MSNYNRPTKKPFLTPAEQARAKQELAEIWKQSKPHLIGAFKFLFGVLIQPHMWKEKYSKLGKTDKEAVQTGSFLIAVFSIVTVGCIWFVKHNLFS